MFSFGQFSQFLPFVILAITTLASYSTVTYSRHAMKTEDEACEQKEIVLDETPEIRSEKIASFFHSDHNIVNPLATNTITTLPINQSFHGMSPPGVNSYLVMLHSPALPFLRPPPVCS